MGPFDLPSHMLGDCIQSDPSPAFGGKNFENFDGLGVEFTSQLHAELAEPSRGQFDFGMISDKPQSRRTGGWELIFDGIRLPTPEEHPAIIEQFDTK